jgi:hypothetical protein
VADSFISVDGYQVFRTDVAGVVPKHGVLFYVRNTLSCVSVEVLVPNAHVVLLRRYNLYLVVLYRPPSYAERENQQVVDFLLDFCGDKEVVVLGDFNLPTVDWGSEVGCVPRGMGVRDGLFLDCFSSLGLVQWVFEPTFVDSGNILDLVLTSEDDRIDSVQVLPPFPRCHHCVVLVRYCFQFDAQVAAIPQRKRCWHRGKYYRISESLGDIDWEFEFRYLSVDLMFARFLSLMSPLVSEFVPQGRAEGTFSSPWTADPPRELTAERSRAWNNYKAVRGLYGRRSELTVDALSHFNDLNFEYRNFSVTSQASYEQSLISEFCDNRKMFHSYIRRKKVGRVTVGPLTDDATGELTGDCLEMAEMFAAAFASVYRADRPPFPAPHQVAHSALLEIDITRDDVVRVLQGLDVSSSMGPDGMHPMLLKSCAEHLSVPLYAIFNASLASGVLPQHWLVSEVVPIFKKGSRRHALNYRPISLTSVVCKSLERLVVENLYGYIESNSLLSDDQFGFRRGRSVEDQLLLTYDSVTDWLDSGMLVDVVLFDFSKAFDVVCHSVLLDKLRGIGVSGSVLEWISGFLSGRDMYVSVDGVHSQPRSVVSGVPQGSVLGPVLFLIYVNQVPAHILSRYKIFADDLKIYLGMKSKDVRGLAAGAAQCQRDIDILCNTAESWGLSMNIAKCVVMRFQRGNPDWGDRAPHDNGYFMRDVPMEFVESHSDLGITIDLSLKFHVHIRGVAARAGGLASNLLKSTRCRGPEFMVSLYVAHIRPLLEFSSCVWHTGYVGDLRLLESVQRRWTKSVAGLRDVDYGDRLRILDLFSVKGRLIRADLIKVWKIFNGQSALKPEDVFQVVDNPRTRGHSMKLAHRYAVLEARRRYFSFRVVPLWNSLPGDVVSLSELGAFKGALRRCLGDVLFEFCGG